MNLPEVCANLRYGAFRLNEATQQFLQRLEAFRNLAAENPDASSGLQDILEESRREMKTALAIAENVALNSRKYIFTLYCECLNDDHDRALLNDALKEMDRDQPTTDPIATVRRTTSDSKFGFGTFNDSDYIVVKPKQDITVKTAMYAAILSGVADALEQSAEERRQAKQWSKTELSSLRKSVGLLRDRFNKMTQKRKRIP